MTYTPVPQLADNLQCACKAPATSAPRATVGHTFVRCRAINHRRSVHGASQSLGTRARCIFQTQRHANEFVLRCVSAERIALIERRRVPRIQPIVQGDNSLALAEARFEQGKRTYANLVKLYPQAEKSLTEFQMKIHEFVKEEPTEAGTESTGGPHPKATVGERDEYEVLRLAMPDLARLARYERRAWSKRKKALRRFVEIKAMA
jgi:hypothetical protein